MEDLINFFTESTPYPPSSTYSASKASFDMIVRSYGMNTVITNCSNNYGSKLRPIIIRKALTDESIPTYRDGKIIRDWLYLLDRCRNIDLVDYTWKEANVYNIDERNERTNLQIVDAICTMLVKKYPTVKSYITFVEDNADHDRRYAIFATKFEIELGWGVDTGIVKTVDLYLHKHKI